MRRHYAPALPFTVEAASDGLAGQGCVGAVDVGPVKKAQNPPVSERLEAWSLPTLPPSPRRACISSVPRRKKLPHGFAFIAARRAAKPILRCYLRPFEIPPSYPLSPWCAFACQIIFSPHTVVVVAWLLPPVCFVLVVYFWCTTAAARQNPIRTH